MGVLWWFKFPLRFKEMRRLRQVLGVLGRHGFRDIAFRMSGIRGLGWLGKGSKDEDFQHIPVERRIRIVLEELGPTFIKMGQVMASRPDILPMSMIKELEKLQDNVPPEPFEDIKDVIEAELGRPMTDVFRNVVAQPIAAASIAQVHRAELMDGQHVVLKVQRPNAEAIVKSDMKLLAILSQVLEDKIPEIRRYKPRDLIREFTNTLAEEMDFVGEMENLQRYRSNFRDEEDLHTPKPFPELCSRRLLVMEEVGGTKVTNLKVLKEKGIDLKKVLDVGMRVTMRSIFEFGFFHADPHPGNFFVEDDGTIVLIDFGMVGVIDDARIDDMATFMVSVVTGDTETLVNLLLEMDLVPDGVDLRRLRTDIGRLLVRYQSSSIGSIDTGQFLNRIFDVMGRYSVAMPADMMLVGKAIATLEGIGRTIFPEFSPIDYMKPYLTKVYTERVMDPKRQSAYAYKAFRDVLSLVKDGPYDIRRVLRKLRKGEIQVNLKSQSVDGLRKSMAVRSNRMLYGMMSLGFSALGLYASSARGYGFIAFSEFAVSGGFFILLMYSLLFND